MDSIKGTVEEVVAQYIIRDHDRTKFEERKAIFLKTAKILEEKYGAGVVQVEMIDSYCNMREMIEKKMHIVDNMAIAMETGMYTFSSNCQYCTCGMKTLITHIAKHSTIHCIGIICAKSFYIKKCNTVANFLVWSVHRETENISKIAISRIDSTRRR